MEELRGTKVPGAILAGGRSRRMGADKALLVLEGETLLERARVRFEAQVAGLALVVGAGGWNGPAIGLPVVTDAVEDAGPLGGVLAALLWAAAAGAERIITVPVDCPFLPADLAPRLTAAASAPVVAAASAGRRHNVAALWTTSLAPRLRSALEAGRNTIAAFQDAVGVTEVAFDESEIDPFFNVNTPADMELAISLVRGDHGRLP